jgi:hypothetical protein
MVATRGSEAVLRASTYRAGYELFYTPVPPKDKRAVKSIIDVGVDRTGDIVGATITQRLLQIPQPGQTTVLLSLAMGCSALALVFASRMKRGYSDTLEKSLLSRAVELDVSDAEDLVTRTTILRTQRMSQLGRSAAGTLQSVTGAAAVSAGADGTDPEIRQIETLKGQDRRRIVKVLRQEAGVSAALVPHVIPLLARDDVSDDSLAALRAVADERAGALIDALVDPTQPFAVRRRLPRALSGCTSQRPVDGLLLGLNDLRFEVRFQCGRSLLAIREKTPGVRIDHAAVLACVEREVGVNKDVWEGRRLIDAAGDGDQYSFLEELVRGRASQALAHVFTLLALVLPAEPLRIAFRALHTDDKGLRGTALEYLEGVLPRGIRERLWPFLEDRQPLARTGRPQEEVLAELLRSNASINLKLEEYRKGAAVTEGV